MGASKKTHFDNSQLELSAFAKAMAHPARIAILQHLLKMNSCVCGDIVDVLPLAQSTVSQHLKELKKAGLLKGEMEGTSVCYCIDVENWKKAEAIFTALFSDLQVCCDTKCC